MKRFICLLLVVTHIAQIKSQGNIVLQCPQYVMENEDGFCLCRTRHKGNVTVQWLVHSNTSALTLTNVQRSDNGTQYTCAVTTPDGLMEYANYTLLVAYGPSEDHLQVGPSQIITDGSQTINLTCDATEVYPPPQYTWRGIRCVNKAPPNTCSFKPRPASDDQKDVVCEARSRVKYDNTTATKRIRLDLLYPPRDKPVIQPLPSSPGYTNVQSGDTLTCTVTGGKPPVESVKFFCLNPYLPDQQDERRSLSVSSSVTVTAPHDHSDVAMMCYCRAVWETRPEFYQAYSVAAFTVKIDDEGHIKIIYGVAIGLPSIVLIVVAIIVWKRCKRTRSSNTSQVEVSHNKCGHRSSGLYDEARDPANDGGDTSTPTPQRQQGRALPLPPGTKLAGLADVDYHELLPDDDTETSASSAKCMKITKVHAEDSSCGDNDHGIMRCGM